MVRAERRKLIVAVDVFSGKFMKVRGETTSMFFLHYGSKYFNRMINVSKSRDQEVRPVLVKVVEIMYF